MGSYFNSNTVIGLVDKHTGKVKVEDKINIILTPSFYWVKRAYLEVRFAYSALKYAPSIFEGMLPEGDYSYYVVKTKKEYIFFAYDPDEIISSLNEKGILATQINGIYFAQNEMSNISAPVECNEMDALVLHKDTIIQVKKYLIDETNLRHDLDEIRHLSKHKITLHKSSIRHSVKELAPLMSVLAALIVLYTAQLFFSYSQQDEIKALPSVFEEYKLPSTFVQNSSIEKKLRKNFKEQKSFRNLIFAILELPLSQQQRIEHLSYEKELFQIVFKMEDYAKLKDLKLQLEKSVGELDKIEIDKNIMRVKIK